MSSAWGRGLRRGADRLLALPPARSTSRAPASCWRRTTATGAAAPPSRVRTDRTGARSHGAGGGDRGAAGRPGRGYPHPRDAAPCCRCRLVPARVDPTGRHHHPGRSPTAAGPTPMRACAAGRPTTARSTRPRPAAPSAAATPCRSRCRRRAARPGYPADFDFPFSVERATALLREEAGYGTAEPGDTSPSPPPTASSPTISTWRVPSCRCGGASAARRSRRRSRPLHLPGKRLRAQTLHEATIFQWGNAAGDPGMYGGYLLDPELHLLRLQGPRSCRSPCARC